MESPQLLCGLPPQNPDGKNQTCAKQRHERIMGKLKDSIFTTLMGSNPSRTLTQETKSYVENKLRGMFQNFDTPTHPPYALMIRTAIIELNEEVGSSEESISGFIEKEFEGLPCVHVAFLSHHLRRLCESGEIVRKNDGRYMIGVGYGNIPVEEEMGKRTNIRQCVPHACHVREELQNELKEDAAEETQLIEQKIEEVCQAERRELQWIDDWSKVKEKQIIVFEEQQRHAVEKQEVEERSETSGAGLEETLLIEQKTEEDCQAEGEDLEVINDCSKVKEKEIVVFEEQQQHVFKKQEVEEPSDTSRQSIEATEQQIEVLCLTQGPSVELNVEVQNCPQNQVHEAIEEPNHLQKQQSEVCEEYTSLDGQQNKVIEEKYIFQEQQTVLYLTQGPSEELNGEEQNCDNEVIEELNHLPKLHTEVCEEYTSVYGQQNQLIVDQNLLQEQPTELRNEDQLVNIPNTSETIGQCFDCNSLSYSLKESSMELVTKKTEFLDRLMENLNSFGVMDQQQWLTESPCTERASNVEVIEEQKLLHEREDRLIRGESQSLEHQNQVETKLLSLYCVNGGGVSENLSVGESPFPAVKEESLKQVHLRQQAMISRGDWNHIVVCGLKTQQFYENCDKPKTPKSQPVKTRQQLSWSRTRRRRRRPKLDADTTTNALPPSDHEHDIDQLGADTNANIILLSDHHHDIERKQDYLPEGQLRPSKAEGNEQPHQSRSRSRMRCRAKLEADASMSFTLALPSDQQHHSEQKLHHQPEGQLRPSKAEGNGDQQKAPESQLDNEQPHRSRRRARMPCRPKLDANATMSVILKWPSDQQQNIEQKLQHQPEGQGWPSNAEGNEDHHQSLRIYVRRKHRQ